MRGRSKLLRLGMITLATLALGCGDDTPDDGPSEGTPDAAYPEARCPESTPTFAIGLEASGEEQAVTARLVSAAPAPPELYLNDWTLDFVDAAGDPIEDLEIENALPYMPVHGHDGIYAPEVEPLDEPGRFAVNRLNLWMRGPWQVQLTVSSASAGDDYVQFDVCVE